MHINFPERYDTKYSIKKFLALLCTIKRQKWSRQRDYASQRNLSINWFLVLIRTVVYINTVRIRLSMYIHFRVIRCSILRLKEAFGEIVLQTFQCLLLWKYP